MNKNTQFSKPYWLLDEEEDKPTEFVVIVSSTGLYENKIGVARQMLKNNNIEAISFTAYKNNKVVEFLIKVSTHDAWRFQQKVLFMSSRVGIDIVVSPVATRKKKLLVCDMDSTIVATETLDDVAEKIGIGEQVSDITERAMRGELDFRQALQERVGLLEGLIEPVLGEIAESIQFNPGAELLIGTAKQDGIRTVLVSGGFEPIVKTVAEELGFDRFICNNMEVENGQLTGKVMEPLVDGKAKLNMLLEECKALNIDPAEACSIGDGANDIAMLQAAGLGIGYYGKPRVREATPYQLNASDLEAVYFMIGVDSK